MRFINKSDAYLDEPQIAIIPHVNLKHACELKTNVRKVFEGTKKLSHKVSLII